MSTLKAMPQPAGKPGTESAGAGASPWSNTGRHGSQLSLEDYPSALLMRVANLIQAEVTGVYARQHELSIPEWRLLARLHESAPMQLSALCRTSFFDKAYAGRVLRSLEARGLVATRVDVAHRRRQIVDITEAGRSLARRITPIARRSQMRLLEALDAHERDALYTMLKKLYHAAPGVAAMELRLAAGGGDDGEKE